MKKLRKAQFTFTFSDTTKIGIIGGLTLVALSRSVWADPPSNITIEEGVTVVSGQEITSNDVTLNNYGIIEVTGAGGKGSPKFAIFVPGTTDANNFTLNNGGVISAEEAFPLAFRTDGNSFIFNQSGGIITAGTSNALGTVIDVSSGRLEVTNSGYIGSDVYDRTTFDAFNGGTLIIRNDQSGTIASTGVGEAAIDGYFLPGGTPAVAAAWGVVHVENEGRIVAEGAAVSLAASSTINNRGWIQGGDAAIVANGNDNEVTLGPGSTLVGDIEAGAGTTGNKLIFDIGSSTSFIYQTTGPWQLQDLDGRAVVEGSAMAAGIGNAETADELMFDRSMSLDSSLARLERQSSFGERQALFDAYGFSQSRDEDGTTSAYDLDSRGMTIGLPLELLGNQAIAFVNYHDSEIDIASGTHDIDAQSVRFGLSAPKMWSGENYNIGVYAVAGRNSYDGVRDVLVNQNTTTGITTINASWDSTELEIGADVTSNMALASKLTLDSSLGLAAQVERVASYSEQNYFAWDNRTIVQAHAKAEVKLGYQATDTTRIYGTAGAWRRDVRSGETAHYTINNTAVSYNGGVYDDTISSLRFGLGHRLGNGAIITAEASAIDGGTSDRSYGASLGVAARF